ncbi:n19m, NADH-ubiquinone oxidoreductase 9.5 kDa subunit [Malassezia cuniculi]|uniref:N19m, NADH-ubiquinone oxidoreductase 9.5 kDa subunit n=1 Tax=Malassezia cuniculi TaxID=948313 RepID=A0AAF0EX65_9BASI|nr:n19m, NADH-ubiquinone oxidoreductase 9.5 kDa subunit [Malassezia cuniculi]
MLSAAFKPFRSTYNYLRYAIHDQPVIFWAIVIGVSGPAMVVTVPRIRANFGWVPPEPIPITYPLPNRERKPVSGYDDE